MNTTKSLMLAGIVALACATPLSHAGVGDTYSATFQGITFTFTQTLSDQLSFNIAGTPGGNWTGLTYLGAFDIKADSLGLSANGGDYGTANGPGATDLLSANKQLSASGPTGSTYCAGNGLGNSFCFNLSPDLYVGTGAINLTYIIDFSKNLNIASTGPHLQICWDSSLSDGNCIGSLYSQDVGGTTKVPEPNSGSLTLLGLAAIGVAMWGRRRRAVAFASA